MNFLLLLAYRALALISFTPKSLVQKNKEHNEKLLSIIKDGSYIEDQSSFSDVLIGKRNISYCGCGVIAVYNALIDLKSSLSPFDFLKILEKFQKKGLALSGLFGISPISIRRFINKNGYKIAYSSSNKDEKINQIGADFDTFICTIYHKKNNPKYGIHHIAVTKDENGKFITHNPYHVCDSLSSAIKEVAMYNGSALYTIGIKK